MLISADNIMDPVGQFIGDKFLFAVNIAFKGADCRREFIYLGIEMHVYFLLPVWGIKKQVKMLPFKC
jgi:hypothetical protein